MRHGPLILLTGAGGNIGSQWAAHAGATRRLRLVDRTDESLQAVAEHGDTVVADLTDLDAVKAVCDGVDEIVHLAATPDPSATWDELLPLNIEATYNVFVAAKAAGVKRVVYASSIHAVGGYPADRQVRVDDPVNPGTLYGVTKCFGEALARYMGEQEGVQSVAIRIGAFQPPETPAADAAVVDFYVSPRDLCQLIDRALDADLPPYTVLHGLSDDHWKRLDLTDTKRITGFRPLDDGARFNDKLREALPDPMEVDVQDPGVQSGLRSDL